MQRLDVRTRKKKKILNTTAVRLECVVGSCIYNQRLGPKQRKIKQASLIDQVVKDGTMTKEIYTKADQIFKRIKQDVAEKNLHKTLEAIKNNDGEERHLKRISENGSTFDHGDDSAESPHIKAF